MGRRGSLGPTHMSEPRGDYQIDQRRPRERNSPYLGWIAALPCAVAMAQGRIQHGVHVAHLRVGSVEHGKRATGLGEKPDDRWCLPLSPEMHVNGPKSQHAFGDEVGFWAQYGIDPFELSLVLQEAYAKGKPGLVAMARYIGAARAR